MARHGVHTAQVGDDVLRLTAGAVTTGTEVRAEPTAGEVYARHISMIGQRPGSTFSGLSIADMLDVVGLSGVNIADLSGGLKVWAGKWADGATRAAGSVHRKYTINKGLLHLGTLSCEHRGDAKLDMAALATWDTSNDPVVIGDSQALPALPGEERFTLGPVTIESISMGGLKSLSIDFAVTAETEGSGSGIWDTESSIATIIPIITMRGIDIEWLKATNIPLEGKKATHANTEIYLRKYDDGSSYKADNVSEHIKFTAAGLAYIDTCFDASGNDTGESSLVMVCQNDGSNDPIVIDTAATIT